ncbi:MAG: LysR family transcriptional regulator [Rhizobiaceae bacterium]
MLNFTLKQLRYIDSAERLGSITHAAKEQNISQSSIAAAIDSMESELGYSLFIRTPAKGLQTTPSGLETLQLIRSFIDQSQHFEGEIKSVGGEVTGSLRIGCYATAAPAFLPPVLKSFTEKYPNISITLLEGNMETITGFLDNGDADLIFTFDQTITKHQTFLTLFKAPPYVLLSVDDPLVKQGTVSLTQIYKNPMVMLDLPLAKAYYSGLFHLLDLQPNIAHTTRSAEIARALVAGGFGYSILNIRPVDYEIGKSGYVILPISDNLQVQNFGLSTLSTVYRPKIVQAFIDHCSMLRDSGVFSKLIVEV